MKYQKLACNLKLHDALYSMGLMYELGKGVPVDEKKASEYYQLAGNAGNFYAQNKFDKLTRKSYKFILSLSTINLTQQTEE